MTSIFRLGGIFTGTLFFATSLAAPEALENESKLHVAIVGAGITGASAAYHLNSAGSSTSISITIFEKEAQVGGRILSTPYFGNYVAELGASHFSLSDQCLVNTVNALGLQKKSEARPVGLWNGTELLRGGQGLPCAIGVESGSGTLQDLITEGRQILFPPVQVRRIVNKAIGDFTPWATRLWRHGALAPRRFHSAAAEDLDRWKHFGGNNSEPFDSLKTELRRIGLSDDALGSAKEYAGLGDSIYGREAIEPCTRDRASQNLNHVRALSTVISTDPGRAVTLWDGNAKLIDDMIKRSGAVLKTNSKVVQIKPGADRRYYIETEASGNGGEFDVVLLAGGPDQDLSSILSNILPPNQIPTPPPYTETHVTHFSAEEFLHLPHSEDPEQDVSVPQDVSAVYFTNSLNSNAPDLLHASTSIARKRDPVCEVDFDCDEFIYRRVHRIVSRSALSDAEIARLMGVAFEAGDTLEAKDIIDVQRAAWPHAFPVYQKPHHELWDDIELAPALFYLGAGDALHSSLEMGCRMGRNTARLIHSARGGEGSAHASGEVENRHATASDTREL